MGQGGDEKHTMQNEDGLQTPLVLMFLSLDSDICIHDDIHRRFEKQ